MRRDYRLSADDLIARSGLRRAPDILEDTIDAEVRQEIAHFSGNKLQRTSANVSQLIRAKTKAASSSPPWIARKRSNAAWATQRVSPTATPSFRSACTPTQGPWEARQQERQSNRFTQESSPKGPVSAVPGPDLLAPRPQHRVA